jgi:hypothetical protein
MSEFGHCLELRQSAPKQVQVSATLDESLVNSARALIYTESVSELLERALKLYVEHHSKRQGRPAPTATPTENNAEPPCRQRRNKRGEFSKADSEILRRNRLPGRAPVEGMI